MSRTVEVDMDCSGEKGEGSSSSNGSGNSRGSSLSRSPTLSDNDDGLFEPISVVPVVLKKKEVGIHDKDGGDGDASKISGSKTGRGGGGEGGKDGSKDSSLSSESLQALLLMDEEIIIKKEEVKMKDDKEEANKDDHVENGVCGMGTVSSNLNHEDNDDDDDIRIEEVVVTPPLPILTQIKNQSGGGVKRRAPSASPSPSASTKEEKRTVEDELLCNSCGLLSIPPISSCVAGHLICAVCVDTIAENGKCPVMECTSKSPSRSSTGSGSKRGRIATPKLMLNAFADNLLKRNVPGFVACRNKKRLGCRVKLPLGQMYEHLKQCRNKIIKCFASYPSSCGGRLLSEEKFLEHLEIYHESKNLRFEINKTNDPVIDHACFLTRDEILGSAKLKSSMDFVKYKKDVFFFHCAKEENALKWWITMLGAEADAVKHRYTLSVKIGPSAGKGSSGPSRRILVDDLCVHSMEMNTWAEIKKTGDFLGVDLATLEPFRLKSPEEFSGIKYDFKMIMQIKFKED